MADYKESFDQPNAGRYEKKKIDIDRHDGWKYGNGNVTRSSSGDKAVVHYKGGLVDIEKTYSGKYLHELYPALYDRMGLPIKPTGSNKGKGKSETTKKQSNGNGSQLGCLCTIIFTIIPLLPLWWLIRLPFCLGKGLLTFIWSLLTLPFRCLFTSDDSIDSPISLPDYRDISMLKDLFGDEDVDDVDGDED